MLISVIIDSREPALIQKLAFGGVEKSIAPLDYADSNGSYDLLGICSDSELIVIERATPSDFLGKLRADRLFPQLVQLRAQSRWAYLVITGELRPGANDKAWITDANGLPQETGWAWSAVQGALVTAQEIGISVIYANGPLDYEGTVVRLGNRKHDALRVAPARDTELLSEGEVILSSLPGIGPERARAILAECPSVAESLLWLTDVSGKGFAISGVGDGTKRQVRRALQLDADHALCPVPMADLWPSSPVEVKDNAA